MITEYDSPMKKLSEDFVPHSKVLASIHLVVIVNLIFNYFFFSDLKCTESMNEKFKDSMVNKGFKMKTIIIIANKVSLVTCYA